MARNKALKGFSNKERDAYIIGYLRALVDHVPFAAQLNEMSWDDALFDVAFDAWEADKEEALEWEEIKKMQESTVILDAPILDRNTPDLEKISGEPEKEKKKQKPN